MQGPEFIYFIKRDATHFYRMPASGLQVTTSPTPLRFDPDGWQEISIQNSRNRKYWGIDRTVTIPYSFVEDGAEILKSIIYRFGVEAPAYLAICQQQLYINAVIPATININGGFTSLQPGSNTGTITGRPGTTIYLKIVSNFPPFFVLGSIDATPVYVNGTRVFTITLPASGIVSFNLTSGSYATFEVTNRDGSTQGTYGYWYKLLINAEIDLPSFEHAGYKVTVSMLEDSLPKYLEANESTTYEIPLNVPEAIDIYNDGINLHSNIHYSDIDDLNITADEYGRMFFGPCVFLNKDGDSSGVLVQSEDLERVSSNVTDQVSSFNVLITNVDTKPVVISVTGTLEVKITAVYLFGASLGFYLLRSNTDALNQFSLPLLVMSSLGISDVGKSFKQDFAINLTLEPGESLYRLGAFGSQSDNTTAFEFTTNSKFDIAIITRRDPTITKALRPSYIFQFLIDKISEGNLSIDVAVGSLLDREFNKVFTSGDGIRGIETAVIKTSIEEFFSFWNTWQDAGMIMREGKVTMEKKVDLVDYTTVSKLGEISIPLITLAKEYTFNRFKIGYPDGQTQDTLNGKFAFNSSFEWTLGALKASGELNKICKYKADCFAAETIRINYSPKQTTNSQQDNEVYVMHVEDVASRPDGSYRFNRDLNPYVSGLPETDSLFNVGLSPKRCFYNNSAYLHSCCDLIESKLFQFASTPKNAEMETSNPVVIEKADEVIASLDPQFFRPYYLTFQINGDYDIIAELDANPLRVFSFTINGMEFKGIPEIVGIEPSSRKTQTYKLLCAADTDLKKLINYFG